MELSERFRAIAGTLEIPISGTENMIDLLCTLIRLRRPRRIVEIGMGYTTPFIAAAVAEVTELAAAESLALAEKSRPYVANGKALDDACSRRSPICAIRVSS